MFGKKILNKSEQKHLRENKIHTKYSFERQVVFQKEQYEALHKGEPHAVCWDCIHIAKKLDMWED